MESPTLPRAAVPWLAAGVALDLAGVLALVTPAVALGGLSPPWIVVGVLGLAAGAACTVRGALLARASSA